MGTSQKVDLAMLKAQYGTVYCKNVYGVVRIFTIYASCIGLAKTVLTIIRRIWIRRITVSVYGNFRPYPYPYDCTRVLADRICTPYLRSEPYIRRLWTIFAGGAGFSSQQQQSFLLYLVDFLFSRLFLLSSSFASLFYWCMCYALITSFIGGCGSWTPFCTEKGLLLVFLAWSRPSSLTVHFLGVKDWVMHTQLFKSCKMTPLWFNSEWIHFPSHMVYIRKYGVYTVIYGVYTVYGNPMYGLGQP